MPENLTMKKIIFGCTAALLILSVSVIGQAGKKPDEAKEPEGMKMPSPEEMKAMMDKWLRTIQPGEHHRKLEPFVGNWDTVIRMWMAGPTAPPTESKGTSQCKWVLGGRYVQEEHKGEMMMPDPAVGMKKVPYEGIGMLGYDNYKNLYVGSWTNNLSTEMLIMRGAMDPTGKVLTQYGEMDEAMLDVYGRMIKYVTRIVDKDKHIMEIYDLHAGEGYRVVEITYTRKAG